MRGAFSWRGRNRLVRTPGPAKPPRSKRPVLLPADTVRAVYARASEMGVDAKALLDYILRDVRPPRRSREGRRAREGRLL